MLALRSPSLPGLRLANHPAMLAALKSKLTSAAREATASSVAWQEIFAPEVSVEMFHPPEAAFERANNIPCGLSAGVWTLALNPTRLPHEHVEPHPQFSGH